jgi:adenylate kinase family enzyme
VVVVERVVVIGCAGSGKSRLARQLAERTGLPLVERDGLEEEGSPGYLSAIAEMAARPAWILDGAPYYADEVVYSAADTVVFLDYRKALVMWRVVWRTARVELFRRPAGAHRPKGLSALRDREHPVRWAWTSHADRHREGLALMARPGLAHIQILRFTRPAMARRWLCQIISP